MFKKTLSTLFILGISTATLVGCSTKQDNVITKVELLTVDKCSEPIVPELPSLTLPPREYNHIETLKFLKNLAYRDIIMRNYITGLQDTITCYEKQVDVINNINNK